MYRQCMQRLFHASKSTTLHSIRETMKLTLQNNTRDGLLQLVSKDMSQAAFHQKVDPSLPKTAQLLWTTGQVCTCVRSNESSIG